MFKPYYMDDGFVLYNGDCLDIMRGMRVNGLKVDKIITSPPYNIIRPNLNDRGYDQYKDSMTVAQYADWTVDIFNRYDGILNPNGRVLYNMSYGSENTTGMILTVAEILKRTKFTLGDILVWKKTNAFPNDVSPNKMTRIVEFVFVFCRKDEFNTYTTNKRHVSTRDNGQKMFENVFNFFSAANNDGRNELNKRTFSTEFVDNLIDRYVRKTDIVLDNFSGTGTTAGSCMKHGIESIGIELSTRQCDYTVNRITKGVQLCFA